MKWGRVAPNTLVWRSWDDDEFVVYHTGTGDTHVLNDVAAQLLSSLEVESLSAAELASGCARVYDVDVDEALLREIEMTLNQFDELGLIEAAP